MKCIYQYSTSGKSTQVVKQLPPSNLKLKRLILYKR